MSHVYLFKWLALRTRKRGRTMKSFQISPRTIGSDSDGSDHVHDHRMAILTKQVAIAEIFEKKGRSRFVTSQIPSDLTILVNDISFHVHKYPLLSRCGYINQLNLPPSDSTFVSYINLNDFPGGPDTFETILKFCYDLAISLTPTNIAPLRCASEFLEMTEDFHPNNLISTTEAFLTTTLSSWRNSILVLNSCSFLSPWADNLQITRRCAHSIASSTVDTVDDDDDKQWWFHDVSTLCIDHFVRMVTAMRAKGVAAEIVGACIAHYTERWVPGFEGECEGRNELHLSVSSGRRCEVDGLKNKEKRLMVESLVSILPQDRGAVSCGFLLRILKMAVVYSASPALVSELEKRVGMVLEDATVSDLLIPNYMHGDGGVNKSCAAEESTLHDVDVVQRIVEYFLMHEQQQHEQKCAKIAVGKLLDGYLAEIARDPNLSITKFQQLAEALPGISRTCHDGLYRAIDTYLKSHPSLVEYDRRRLCRVMGCEKLSLDACLHAAHNERLPLRTVVQVLFTEQAKMRAAIQERDSTPSEKTFSSHESSISSTKKEIKSLKTELENAKAMLEELQRNYLELQQEFEKLNKQKSGAGWSSGWKKIRNSALFINGKMDDEEIEVGPATPKNAQGIFRSRGVSIS